MKLKVDLFTSFASAIWWLSIFCYSRVSDFASPSHILIFLPHMLLSILQLLPYAFASWQWPNIRVISLLNTPRNIVVRVRLNDLFHALKWHCGDHDCIKTSSILDQRPRYGMLNIASFVSEDTATTSALWNPICSRLGRYTLVVHLLAVWSSTQTYIRRVSGSRQVLGRLIFD